jgi:hypothetical protein
MRRWGFKEVDWKREMARSGWTVEGDWHSYIPCDGGRDYLGSLRPSRAAVRRLKIYDTLDPSRVSQSFSPSGFSPTAIGHAHWQISVSIPLTRYRPQAFTKLSAYAPGELGMCTSYLTLG